MCLDVAVFCIQGGRDMPVFIAFEHPTVVTAPVRIVHTFKLLQKL